MTPALIAALVLLAPAAAPAPKVVASPAAVSTASGSPYAEARRACARQGKRMKLVATQTNDKYTGVGVAVTARCVPAPKRK